MPEDTFSIELSKKEVMNLVRGMTDFSKRLDTLKTLQEEAEEYWELYERLESFGQTVFHSVLTKCPKELVPDSWVLKIIGKWTDRQIGEDEEQD